MKFSIIIPIYNVEKYIEKCLESIDNQNYGDYEIILVNDGSTDDSARICESFVARSNRSYQIINQENGGLAAARNTGILAADVVEYTSSNTIYLPIQNYESSVLLHRPSDYQCPFL